MLSTCVHTATIATNNDTDANARTSIATARTMTHLLLERIGNIVRGLFQVNRLASAWAPACTYAVPRTETHFCLSG